MIIHRNTVAGGAACGATDGELSYYLPSSNCPACHAIARHNYGELMARVDRINAMVRRRALAALRAAHLSDFGHLHNALVSLEWGRPWREVDYSAARRAKWLFEKQSDAAKIARRLYETGRTWTAINNAGHRY